MRRTVFTKIFLNNIIILTISLLVLTVSGGWLLMDLTNSDRDTSVAESARAIHGFLESGVSSQVLDNFLYGISQSSNKSILLVNSRGEILLASVNNELYNKGVSVVPRKDCEAVLRGERVKVEGTLGNVYKKKMITYQFPYKEPKTGRIMGAILISMPSYLIEEAQARLFGTMLLTIGIVVVFALLLSYALSRRISKPMREITGTVKNFAKGDFASRVKLSGKNYNVVEIQDLADTFNDMAFHMEKAEELRNGFISDVSHELRTPMTSIGGFVDGIMDGTIPEEKHGEYLAIVKDEVARLSALVNSFLDVTRNENEKTELERTNFDINEVIRRTVINLESKIVEKEIFVDIVFETDPCFVNADKNLIKSVLTNLLENAVKFTDKRGKIKIAETSRQQEVILSIYNTGCGVAENDKAFIFERFFKGDKSRSLNRDGNGIGLYIVKNILGRHGKKIVLNSVEGEYAEFVFSLDKGKEK